MKDRIARTTNRAQTLAIDALTARVNALEGHLIDTAAGLGSRLDILASDLAHLRGLVDPLFPAVRDLTARVEALELPVDDPPVDPPEDTPPSGWRTIWAPQKIADWSATVRDAGQITNPEPGRFRFRIEAPVGAGSHHCELQQQGLSPRGIEIAYEWTCTINPGSVFPTAPASTTIHQSHADNQTGYGGGILAYRDGRLRLHVRGGKVTDPKGSIHREYERDFYLDPFRFVVGEPFRIRREVKWDAVHGYSRCFINGVKLHEALDVPTFPAERAEGSMFRTGFYPGDGEVNPLLDMTVEGLRFEVPVQ